MKGQCEWSRAVRDEVREGGRGQIRQSCDKELDFILLEWRANALILTLDKIAQTIVQIIGLEGQWWRQADQVEVMK